MEIRQVYNLVNAATREALGQDVVLNEDLSNTVDIGDRVFNANAMDKYVKSLVNHIGKVIFVNRLYEGAAPSVMMDGWEYGSVLQKVSTGLPEATINETWELQDGQSYDPHIFHAPRGVEAKFYNKYVTFEVDMSFTEEQLKMSFSNAEQLNGFVSMLYTSVENTMTVKLDELIRRTINNMICETLVNEYTSASTLGSKSGAKAINLLYLYNNTVNAGGTPLTKEKAMTTPEFIRYAAYMIKLTHDRMKTMSTVFNVGGQPRFTPKDLSHIVLLSDFASGADVYLQSDTFHNELTKLPNAERVAYWQGSGTDFSFGQVSKIDVTSQNGAMATDGILGVMFDRWALGVSNVSRKVTSQYTPNAEFFTNFYKYKAGYFNDLNENFVVFFIA